MKGFDNVFERMLLPAGFVFLIVFWLHFPMAPTEDEHLYASYTSADGTVQPAAKWTYLRPDKRLSPQEVVRLQLHALQQNDENDSGVITVFNFASPINRLHLGPINHFRLLVRSPVLQPMLNFESYKAGKLVVLDNTAYQLIVLKGSNGEQVPYLFILAKQQKGKYKGCWMTEGVARQQDGPQSNLI
jgi:hypothetical protein